MAKKAGGPKKLVAKKATPKDTATENTINEETASTNFPVKKALLSSEIQAPSGSNNLDLSTLRSPRKNESADRFV